MRLLLPIGNIGLQQFVGCIGFFQAFGRQDLNALGQQHGSFSLHHDLVLKVFDSFDFFVQLQLQAGKGFPRQRGASFGGISLPSHGVCNVQTIG